MIHGLDLFSGIGGLTIALSPWVTPIAYCENDHYAQSVLLSRQTDGQIPIAPIWEDIRDFPAENVSGFVDIVYGGFPCQDISVAGTGKGLEGERSGLFWELYRLVEEIKPTFVFLENVPAIRTRGLRELVCAFTDLRYDTRWTRVSAAEVGTSHLRQRWFMLCKRRWDVGNTTSKRHEPESESDACEDETRKQETSSRFAGTNKNVADSNGERLEIPRSSGEREEEKISTATTGNSWWAVEPDVGRVAHGVPYRVDRIKGLGNSVVPLQARTAFERLIDLTP